ncbi:uncharacterized protein BT62DRAFT_996519 [Guyanagaster necrorhizus]|uniref:F-box domain-containing protein n=1 Tax=Guyanagaster necrorhizus TaxID=856835 RepID=A0A9P7VL65_9AGAR|nr:uncharacterized protein BT62DRAFT_996519 [Guyanagaster necrorhizus MCA 3950]KAG7442570.1 hypothetical protein BT62DRAFT_996519 [Guyanagaster necrorhizus MCA 3950]
MDPRWDRGGEHYFLEPLYEYADIHQTDPRVVAVDPTATPPRNIEPFKLLSTLPNELFLHIFSFLPTKDLSHIVRTCRHFCDLAQKELYRNLIFRSFNPHVILNAGIWSKPAWNNVPHRLTASANSAILLPQILRLVPRLTQLRELVFQGIDFIHTNSSDLYAIFDSVPNLQRLSFIKSHLPRCQTASFSHLSITQLDMLFITWDQEQPTHPQIPHGHHFLLGPTQQAHVHGHAHGNIFHNPFNIQNPFAALNPPQHHHLPNHQQMMNMIIYGGPAHGPPIPPLPPPPPPPPQGDRLGALKLLAVPTITILRVDWSAENIAYVSQHTDFLTSQTRLHTLELRCLDDSRGPLHFQQLLAKGVRRLVFMPDARVRSLRGADLSGLRLYRGPSDMLPVVMGGRAVPTTGSYISAASFWAPQTYPSGASSLQQKVTPVVSGIRHVMLTTTLDAAKLAPMLGMFAGAEQFESFELKLARWDLEALHAAVYAFPNVRDLRIKWTGGEGIDEMTLVSFSPLFLSRLCNLRILHLYDMSIKEYVVSDGFELIGPGKRLAGLVEVRLQSGAVWKRAAKDEWTLRKDFVE